MKFEFHPTKSMPRFLHHHPNVVNKTKFEFEITIEFAFH